MPSQNHPSSSGVCSNHGYHSPPEVANTTNQVQRDARMVQVGLEMGSRYVGPIEPKVFLDTYLPQKGPKGKPTKIVGLTKKLKTDLEKVSKSKNEMPMYGRMIKALKSTCGRRLVLIDTHADADNVAWAHQSDLIKPDILVYDPAIHDPPRKPKLKPRKKVGMRRNDITRAEFFWEFKWRERDDGFDDGAGEVSDDEEEEAKEAEDVFDEEVVDGESGRNEEEGEEEEDIDMERDGDEQLGAEKEQDTAPPFEKERKDSGDTRNQMATYAGAILCSQFRTHLFSIQVTRTRARLLRWDREGAIVTSSFVFAEEPYLVEFIKRFAKASREDRGHDPCVTEVENLDLQARVREALEDYSQYKIFKFTFRNEQANETPVTFYGGKIVFEGNACPTGRSTRGFLVVDEECKNKAYLKDTWRIAKPGMQKEGDIYKVLKENNVQKIPGVVACGDAVGRWQQTVTGLFSEKDDAARRPHQHYFIVLDTIGRRLTEFKTLGELLNAMKDALQAHYEACTKAKILHRDISVGNILITKDGGLLIDWDFSRPFEVMIPRQPERTGTWQFMSAKLLLNENPPVPHLVADDLEAFYHVLCYMFWRYCKHPYSDEDVRKHMALFFDWSWLSGNQAVGGDVKRRDFEGRYMARRTAGGKLGNQTTITSLIIAVEEVIGVVRYDDPPDADDRNDYHQFLLAANAPQATLAKNMVYKYDNYRDKLETTEWLWHQFCAATVGDRPELKDLRVSRNLSTQKPQGKTGNLYTKTNVNDNSPAKKKQRTETSKPSRSRPGPGRSKSRSKSKPTAGPSRSGLRSTTQSTAGSSRYNLRSGSRRTT